MSITRLQGAAIAILAVLIPVEMWLITEVSSAAYGIAFVVLVYILMVLAIVTSLMRYVRVDRIILPHWRRTLYASSLAILVFLSLCPLASWPVALTTKPGLHLRPVILTCFGLQIAAAVLVWFGRGWQRIGLLVVNYWVLFLWLFPLSMRE